MSEVKSTVHCKTVTTMETQSCCTAPPTCLAGSAFSDPIWTLWRDFSEARSHAQRHTHRQQAIESMMVEHIGFPVTHSPPFAVDAVNVAGLENAVVIRDEDQDQTRLDERQRASYQDQCARWSAADAELGYSAALRAEGRALCRVRELAEHLWATPAASLTGVMAKLDALLSEGAPSSEAQEFPWPQLRAIRADLEFLRQDQPRTPGR